MEQPSLGGGGGVQAGLFVSLPLAETINGYSTRISQINLVLRDEVDPQPIARPSPRGSPRAMSKFRVAGVGEVTSRRPHARLTATEAVRSGIRARADGMIWGMSQVPLVTLLITSLAVVNTVVSSVRARRWDFGILRALGTTRGGLMAGWCDTGMARYLSPFGGMSTPLVLPWPQLALGVSTTLGLCRLAAIVPAFTTGRTEPLKLLQAGRGTA